MEIKQKIASFLAIPQEIALNLPQVVLTGHGEVNIENYKSIIEYTDSLVRVNTSTGVLKVEGIGLHLKQMTTENIVISGEILKLEYVR